MTKAHLARGIRHLKQADPSLAMWIERVGPIGLRRQAHAFSSLCRAIVAQQIGGKAAKAMYERLAALFPGGRPEPGRLLRIPERHLRACGLSGRKTEYLRSLAEEFAHGSLRNARFSALGNEEVIARLTRIRGVGRWTAEMFLIFCLGRQDVFSVGDLALRTGVERVEGQSLTHARILAVAERWSPYRSVACLYLWKIAHWGPEPSSD